MGATLRELCRGAPAVNAAIWPCSGKTAFYQGVTHGSKRVMSGYVCNDDNSSHRLKYLSKQLLEDIRHVVDSNPPRCIPLVWDEKLHNYHVE
jgi:hypothetical protein